MRTRQIHLVNRPSGMPTAADFALREADCPDPADGEVLVEGLLMSVDPYMRTRFAAHPLEAPLLGGGIGRVLTSRHPDFRPGDTVRHLGGFQAHFCLPGDKLNRFNPDPDLPLSVYLHALGATGMTAYGGLLEVGALKPGEQVLVSTAAGAVGSVAAQIARLNGCRVVGLTSSDDKATWLRDDLRLDGVINYRTQDVATAIRAAMPNGVDVYFENVGGAMLDAVLPQMNVWGRIPVCGMISTYNGGGEGVTNLFSLIYQRIRMQGFVTPDFAHLKPAFERAMTAWLKAGDIQYRETIVDGIERVPEALIGLFDGANIGKALVRLKG